MRGKWEVQKFHALLYKKLDGVVNMDIADDLSELGNMIDDLVLELKDLRKRVGKTGSKAS